MIFLTARNVPAAPRDKSRGRVATRARAVRDDAFKRCCIRAGRFRRLATRLLPPRLKRNRVAGRGHVRWQRGASRETMQHASDAAGRHHRSGSRPARPRARRRARTQPDFALYLDERWRDDHDVTWPFRVVPWADFGLPADENATFTEIADLYRRARAGELVEVACYGGVGRTGTVLACLAILAGVDPADAVAWVRSDYHSAAIETARAGATHCPFRADAERSRVTQQPGAARCLANRCRSTHHNR